VCAYVSLSLCVGGRVGGGVRPARPLPATTPRPPGQSVSQSVHTHTHTHIHAQVQVFKLVFDPVFADRVEQLESMLISCYDSVGVMLMLRMVREIEIEIKKR
jgi:hypothetical protein